MTHSPIPLGLVGTGWRAEFFLRIAQALPDRFQVIGAVVRNPAKRDAFTRQWNVPALTDVDALRRLRPAFVTVSVPREAAPDLLCELCENGVPVLGETPPAATHESMLALFGRLGSRAPVQIAEQYPFQPAHAARIALVRSGLLGEVSHAQVSVAHGYHGMVILRRLLGIGFESAQVRAMSFHSPIIDGPGRQGPPVREATIQSSQTVAWLQFGSKLGIFDFAGDQYMSWVRSNRLLARGSHGEISNHTVRSLENFSTPVAAELRRWDTGHDGNLEGYSHQGITLGERWVYRNPFARARLSDDEIAVATCLALMQKFVESGEPFYGLSEALQDHYLGLCVEKAAQTSEPVTASAQPWTV